MRWRIGKRELESVHRRRWTRCSSTVCASAFVSVDNWCSWGWEKKIILDNFLKLSFFKEKPELNENSDDLKNFYLFINLMNLRCRCQFRLAWQHIFNRSWISKVRKKNWEVQKNAPGFFFDTIVRFARATNFRMSNLISVIFDSVFASACNNFRSRILCLPTWLAYNWRTVNSCAIWKIMRICELCEFYANLWKTHFIAVSAFTLVHFHFTVSVCCFCVSTPPHVSG
jgi:hypothetical protein